MLISPFPFRRHALALALALATGAADAAILNVSGDCTLINAINNANSDTDTDGAGGCPAGSGADVLELETNAVYTLTEINNTTIVPNGLPLITSVITINGNDATIRRAGEADTPYFRLIEVASTGNLTLKTLRLSGGKVIYFGSGTDYPSGGGIGNSGILSIADSTISGNSAYEGGGLANYSPGSITVTNSTISGNSAFSGGGVYNWSGNISLARSTISGNSAYRGVGIANAYDGNIIIESSTISDNSCTAFCNGSQGGGLQNSGTATLTNSRISGNNAGYGGGIYNASGNVTLINSTLSGNSAALSGGGIMNMNWTIPATSTVTLINSTVSNNYSAAGSDGFRDSVGYGGGISNVYGGSVTLTNSTLSGNKARNGGGGLFNFGLEYQRTSTITLFNTIIANNINGDCSGDGAFNFAATSLIEDGSCGAPLSGDPKLRNLLDNGGLTPTHALRNDSPALAAADPAFCTATDQRNVRRPPSCDLGAFEQKAKIPASVVSLMQFFDAQSQSGGIVATPSGALARRIAVRNQLLTAGDYRNRHLKTEACEQLIRTLGYIDTDNTPESGDYVTGSEAAALVQKITATRTGWSCD